MLNFVQNMNEYSQDICGEGYFCILCKIYALRHKERKINVAITVPRLHYIHWTPLAVLDMLLEVSHSLTEWLQLEEWSPSGLQPPHTPLIPNFDYNLQQLLSSTTTSYQLPAIILSYLR